MNLPAQVNTALQLLKGNGHEAYIVGGCVRDFIMCKAHTDIDITTSAEPNEVIDVFVDYKIIETGLKHGTVTVIIDAMPLEITTYRIDGNYSDNRRPNKVSFTKSIKEDLARRDFTINAIAYNPEVGFIDYFNGREDIDNKIIRAVGNPEERFNEDSLRILRGLRFSSQLGFKIEKRTADAMFSQGDLLKNISAERIASEFIKTLTGENVKKVLLDYTEIFGVVIPEILSMKNFEQKTPYHIYDVLEHSLIVTENVFPVTHLKLAALLHDSGKPQAFSIDEKGIGHFYGHPDKSVIIAEEILARLKFDNFTKERVGLLIKYHDVPIEPTEKSIKRWLHKLSPELFFELIELKKADNIGQNPEYRSRQAELGEILEIAKKIIGQAECFSLKHLAINGDDLIATGIPEGKEIGKCLNRVLQLVMDGELKNDYDSIMRYMNEISNKC